MATFRCAICGTIKEGLKYSFGRKTVCYDCYQQEVNKIKTISEKKNKIYDYIKQVFNIDSLDEKTVDGIDRLLKDGKKEDGILYTIYYVYKVTEHNLELEFLCYNIAKYYQEAKDFYKKQQEISKINQEVDLTQKTVTITIKKSDLEKKSEPKFSYKMEDL